MKKKILIALFACALFVLQSCAVGYPVVGRYYMSDIDSRSAWVPMDGRIYKHKAVLDGLTYRPITARDGLMVYESPDGQYVLEVAFSSVRMSDTSKVFASTYRNEK